MRAWRWAIGVLFFSAISVVAFYLFPGPGRVPISFAAFALSILCFVIGSWAEFSTEQEQR